jgi:signal transduction histidine kinase
VDADRERVLQILSNLVANAIRYTPPGGVVTIRTERAGGETRIAVADTGPGVPADVVPHVFERYFTTARREGGTGLGLYIVKGLVEAHGGRVWLETEPGNGTTFYFSLPDRIAVSAAHHA